MIKGKAIWNYVKHEAIQGCYSSYQPNIKSSLWNEEHVIGLNSGFRDSDLFKFLYHKNKAVNIPINREWLEKNIQISFYLRKIQAIK